MNEKLNLIREKTENIGEKVSTVLNQNHSYFYYALVIVSVVLIVFFLSSKIFLPDNSEIQNSDLDKIYSFNTLTNVNVKVDEWKYNENQNLMVVKLNVSDVTENYNFDLNFEAVAKTQIGKSLNLRVGYKNQNDYYLIIENVPRKYEVISLRIKHIGRQDSKENEIKIYQDYRKINIDNSLKVKTEKEYELHSIQSEIDKNKLKQNELTERNKAYEKEIQNTLSVIERLTLEKKYQTAEEIKVTDNKIITKQREIETTKIKIENNKTSYSSLEEKITKLNEKLKEVRSRN